MAAFRSLPVVCLTVVDKDILVSEGVWVCVWEHLMCKAPFVRPIKGSEAHTQQLLYQKVRCLWTTKSRCLKAIYCIIFTFFLIYSLYLIFFFSLSYTISSLSWHVIVVLPSPIHFLPPVRSTINFHLWIFLLNHHIFISCIKSNWNLICRYPFIAPHFLLFCILSHSPKTHPPSPSTHK